MCLTSLCLVLSILLVKALGNLVVFDSVHSLCVVGIVLSDPIAHSKLFFLLGMYHHRYVIRYPPTITAQIQKMGLSCIRRLHCVLHCPRVVSYIGEKKEKKKKKRSI